MPNDSSTNPLLFNFEPHAVFCGFTLLYLTDLVENRDDRVSHDVTHMIKVGFTMHASFVQLRS